MNKEIAKVKKYYDEGDEELRFSDPRKKIEYINTCEILKKYLPIQGEILDCACGTGAYIEFLMQNNNKVYASDLSDRNIAIVTDRFGQHNNLIIRNDNALDLSVYPDNKFDLILCMGPFYHLKSDLLKKCMQECIRVLKKDSIAVCAYMPRQFVMWNLINNPVYKISFEEVMGLAENGYLKSRQSGFWGCSYFSTPQEMLDIANQFEVEVVEHCSVDLELGNFYDKVKDLSNEELEVLRKYILKHSSNKYCLASSKHNLLIIKKL